jgi:hypothetical protein
VDSNEAKPRKQRSEVRMERLRWMQRDSGRLVEGKCYLYNLDDVIYNYCFILKFNFMTINDFFYKFYQNGLKGKDIDAGMTVILGNVLSENQVQSIPLSNIEHLQVMIAEADKYFILTDSVASNFCAYYNYTDTFPLGRLYFISEKDMFKAAEIFSNLKQRGYILMPIVPKEFAEITGGTNYKLRVEEYKNRKQAENRLFEELLDGRIEETTVGQGFYLKTRKCMFCDKPGNMLISSSSANEDNGIMVGYHLCEEHFQEAKKQDNMLAFLFEKFGIYGFSKTEEITKEEIISDAIAILGKKLNCSILEVTEDTITAVRNLSGYKIILRLTEIWNYGYMIFDNKERQLARFDTADHYKLNYGPNHLHEDLIKNKNKVTTSFTIGIPMIDFVSIQKVIEKFEKLKTKK